MVHFFFRMHDPTTLNRQGNDAGTHFCQLTWAPLGLTRAPLCLTSPNRIFLIAAILIRTLSPSHLELNRVQELNIVRPSSITVMSRKILLKKSSRRCRRSATRTQRSLPKLRLRVRPFIPHPHSRPHTSSSDFLEG